MIEINGKKYFNLKGNNINITNSEGKIIINGEEIKTDEKEVYIKVIGTIEKLEVDNCNSININNGDAETINVTNGNISVTGNVNKNIKTINGNVKINGNVTGNVKTENGNIKYN